MPRKRIQKLRAWSSWSIHLAITVTAMGTARRAAGVVGAGRASGGAGGDEIEVTRARLGRCIRIGVPEVGIPPDFHGALRYCRRFDLELENVHPGGRGHRTAEVPDDLRGSRIGDRLGGR